MFYFRSDSDEVEHQWVRHFFVCTVNTLCAECRWCTHTQTHTQHTHTHTHTQNVGGVHTHTAANCRFFFDISFSIQNSPLNTCTLLFPFKRDLQICLEKLTSLDYSALLCEKDVSAFSCNSEVLQYQQIIDLSYTKFAIFLFWMNPLCHLVAEQTVVEQQKNSVSQLI